MTCAASNPNSFRSFGRTNWRAAAWYLERTRPERYLKQNPALLKPSDLHNFLEHLVEIIGNEVPDIQTMKRITEKLQAHCDPVARSIMEFYMDGRPARPVKLRK